MTRVAARAAVVAVALVWSCSKERGLEPLPITQVIHVAMHTFWENEAEPGTYRSIERWYVYDAESLSLLDSLPFAPGEILPTNTPSEVVILTVDTLSGALQTELYNVRTRARRVISQGVGGSGRIALLNGRSFLIQQATSTCASETYSLDAGSLIQSISGGCGFGESGAESCVAPFIDVGNWVDVSDDTTLSLIDGCTGAESGLFVPRLPQGTNVLIRHARLHPDGRRILIIGLAPTGQGVFVVGDLASGKTTLIHYLSSPFGETAVSPDGTLAAVSDPGDFFTGGPVFVDIFDLRTQTHLARVSRENGLPSNTVGRLRFLSDTRLLSAAGGPGWPNGALAVIDIPTLEVVDTLVLPYTVLPGNFPYIHAVAVGEVNM